MGKLTRERPMRKKPRGRPFAQGNPGRPFGAKNKMTQLMEQIAEGHAEALLQKAIELAQGGDVSCLKMMLDRLWIPRKGRPVDIEVSPIKTSEDLLPAITSIWTALCEGRITPDEASNLAIVADHSLQAIEIHDITKRIAALEDARDKRNEKNNLQAP
jgi:hypothetical protein